DDAFNTAIMVRMTMSIDHSAYWSCRSMLIIQLERRFCYFRTDEWIDYDQSGVAFDDAHIGQIETSDLIDAFDNFEETIGHVELRNSPETWIDCVWRCFVEEGIGGEVPHSAPRILDVHKGQGADKSTLGIVEILFVREGEVRERCSVHFFCPRGRTFAHLG